VLNPEIKIQTDIIGYYVAVDVAQFLVKNVKSSGHIVKVFSLPLLPKKK
jgi:hypothetical protein